MPAQFVTAQQVKDIETDVIHLLADQVRELQYRVRKLETIVEAERAARRAIER